MSETSKVTGIVAQFDALSKAELRQVREALSEKIADVEKREMDAALAHLRHFAKEHGLAVSVGKRGRRRGRPPKALKEKTS